MSFEEGEVIRMTVKYFNKRQDEFVNNFFPTLENLWAATKHNFYFLATMHFLKRHLL